MKQIKSENLGVCPNCEYEISEYGERVFQGDAFFKEFRCPYCYAEGREWYNIVNIEIVVEELNGETLEE